MNKTLLLALALAACAESPTAPPSIDTSGDSKADNASCTAEHDVSGLFDAWADAQGVAPYMDKSEFYMRFVVETDPPTFAVTQVDTPRLGYGYEYQYLLTLDDNGTEVARAPGRYIDRIGPGKYLLDQVYEQVSYASESPLYSKSPQIYASDHEGNALWRLPGRGTAEKARVIRVDSQHWLLFTDFHNTSGPAGLTFFDGNGTVSEPPSGDPRACAREPAHATCEGRFCEQ